MRRIYEVIRNQKNVVSKILEIWFEMKGEVNTEGKLIMEINGKWLESKQWCFKDMYRKYKSMKLPMTKKPENYWKEQSRIADNIKKISKKMTTKEKDLWFRLSKGRISTRANEKHWKEDKKGKKISETCVMCERAKETWKHYNTECETNKQFRQEVAKCLKKQSISEEEWELKKSHMPKEVILTVVKARWIYHERRSHMDNGKRRIINMGGLIAKLKQEMEFCEQKEPEKDK